ncbi:hypothetical protein [Microvirga makkahensis]|uniref:Uncharacterized protein n=1 Tax=Microvirga makkahensis TaxID=1128670 RepID=A0A7X3MQ76_9HYPH|nr:hypothetical protein [Microvirga makkahensis]MXQ11214.1 hypothetical protein [Microvirga makkahensis]
MRLFATFTLLSLSLFWSYPLLAPLAPQIERTVRSKVAPAARGGEPVLVLAPKNVRVPSGETVAAGLTESSEDPRPQ